MLQLIQKQGKKMYISEFSCGYGTLIFNITDTWKQVDIKHLARFSDDWTKLFINNLIVMMCHDIFIQLK